MDNAAAVRTEQHGPVLDHHPRPARAPQRRRRAHGAGPARRLRGLRGRRPLRVAVLTGAGGHFCAGADLRSLADPERRNPIEPTGNAAGPMGPTRMAFSKPVIAAVEGYAVAGGLELALMCDLRVAARSAIFGVFCRRWGVPLIDGGTVRLPRLVGMGRALDMILTGRPVGADEALAIGLADAVVDDGQALAAAQALARQIAAFPQRCMRADRASAYGQWALPLAEALQREGAGGCAGGAGRSRGRGRAFCRGRGAAWPFRR